MEEVKSDIEKDVLKDSEGKIRKFRKCKATKIERKWVIESTDLPEELVEKIVSMMPFPSIFKAKCLSKSWRERFSSVTSKDDEATKILKSSFQNQVSQWSNTWGTFCPVRFHRENVSAYNPASHQWASMPSLIPSMFWGPPTGDLQVDGALLYGFTPSKDDVFVVTNILTRSQKQLPCGPSKRTVLGKTVVSNYGSLGTYKVILFCKSEYDWKYGKLVSYSARIYDSKLNKWRSEKLVIPPPIYDLNLAVRLDLIFEDPVCLNGVLYMVHPGDPQILLAFNVDDGTLKYIRLSFIETPESRVLVGSPSLVVCRGNLLMIIMKRLQFGGQSFPLHVFKIDLGSLHLSEVGNGPRCNCLDCCPFLIVDGKVGCDGDAIFLVVRAQWSGSVEGLHLLSYSVVEDKWSHNFVHDDANGDSQFSRLYSSFEPGLNPFAVV